MNTFIKRQGFLAGILCVVLAATAPATSRAQSGAQPSLVQLRIEAGQIMDGQPPMTATLSNVVKTLQQRDATLSIVLPQELGQIQVGDLLLRDAAPDLAFQALSAAGGNQLVCPPVPPNSTVTPLFRSIRIPKVVD